MPFFSGQGRAYLADITAGVPGPFRWVGDAPQLDLEFETDVLERKESYTGQRATVLRLLREKNANITLSLGEWSQENLALALFGTGSTLAGSSVVDESLAGGATDVAVGDYLRLAEPNASAIVINDSIPVPLVLDTDYRIVSAEHGTIEILDLGSFTQPFTATYTSGAAQNVNMLSKGLNEKWLKLDGVNTADGNAPVLAELYRVAFDPTEALNLISDEFGDFVLNGSALVDETKLLDVTLGAVGRVVMVSTP